MNECQQNTTQQIFLKKGKMRPSIGDASRRRDVEQSNILFGIHGAGDVSNELMRAGHRVKNDRVGEG